MELVKDINKNIFREYDIRGTYGINLDENIAYTIGRSYGSYINELGYFDCVIGQDNRYSSKGLCNALIRGIVESGINVINIGVVTTPLYYYACHRLGVGRGVMVTASHNPKDDNGFKFSFNDNQNCKGKEIEDFYQYTIKGNFVSGDGLLSFKDLKDDYYNYLLSNINIDKNLKVIIDCGNGTTSYYAPELYNMIGVDLMVLYGKSDPSFPNHHPDPTVDENVKVLQDAVLELGCDIGIGFDGDGDRVGIIDNKGRIIRSDVLMAIVVKHLSKKYPNSKFLYDVKCGNTLIDEIKNNNCVGIMSRTGNSYTKALTKENNCIFGGEYSGHVYFRDKFLGFDSGLYAGLRILEILSEEKRSLSDLVDELNHYCSTPEIKFAVNDDKKFVVVDSVKREVLDLGFDVNETDGIRVTLDDGWALVRASNTGGNITFRCEARDEQSLEKIKNTFIDLINKYI